MAVHLTETAVKQVKRMMLKHELGDGYGLRLGVKAGGCAGREYVVELEEGPREKDRVYEFGELRVFVDPKSYLFIHGLEVDFKETLLEAGFIFRNPNASSSCGCGTSFAV
jgi:iron-sulfur cluster assembly protein